MDESGPRPAHLKSPIIERPELQSPPQRTLYGVLTLAFWAFWIYLWLPLLALLAWLLGLQQAYKYMIVLGGYHEILRAAELYAGVILLLGGGLLVWAGYNIYRFRGIENRTAAPALTLMDLGRHFDQAPALVASWHTWRRLEVTHDAKGRIDRVDRVDRVDVPTDGAAAAR